MDYKHHLEACAIVAIFTTILGLTKGIFSKDSMLELWIGFIPYATVITCDLDSATSFVTKLWGPFKIIWKPFVTAGHREILHNWVYGPFIQIGIWLLPALWYKIEVSNFIIIGAVLMLWTHIMTDKFYSAIKKVLKKIMPKFVLKKIKWVI